MHIASVIITFSWTLQWYIPDICFCPSCKPEKYVRWHSLPVHHICSAAVRGYRKSTYKWKPRPHLLLWSLKGTFPLFACIGLFFWIFDITKQHILIKTADVIAPHVFVNADAVLYRIWAIDKMKREPAMISFMENTTSSQMMTNAGSS